MLEKIDLSRKLPKEEYKALIPRLQRRLYDLQKACWDADIPYKSWKLTDEDWRNRDKWDLYEEAINDMILKTSTLTAPWTIVEGNCKWYARVKALRTLVHLLSNELNYVPPDPLSKAEKAKAMAKKDKGKKKKNEKKSKHKGKGKEGSTKKGEE